VTLAVTEALYFFMKEGAALRRIAILDDEKEYLDSALALISAYQSERGVRFLVESFSSPSDFLDKTEQGADYDIFFFDIHMPGITGMNLAAQLREKNTESPIILSSSSPDLAFQAFGVNATHYLLKPYAQKDFFEAIDKALRLLGAEHPKIVLLKISNGYCKVSADKIVYSESDNHYQHVCMQNGESMRVRVSFSELCEKLVPFGHFYPCGKTYIINFDRIDKLLADRVVMENGAVLSIPRRTMPDLKIAYLDYLKKI